MTQKFDLSVWLQNKSRKVVTRDGRPVRIICWDRNTKYWKIIGLVTSPDGSVENPYTYDVNGNESDSCLHDNRNDLFFADEEETLSTLLTELKSYLANTPREQIEKDWKEIQDWYNQHVANKSNEEDEFTEFEEEIKKIMNFLSNEVEEAIITDAGVKEISSRILYLARKEILKDLPKWKKATEDKEFDRHVILLEDEDRVVLTTEIYKDEYYIELPDLKTLPKDE